MPKLTLSELKDLARSIGLSTSGLNKTKLFDSLYMAASTPLNRNRIVSLDIGLRNFALAQVSSLPEIKKFPGSLKPQTCMIDGDKISIDSSKINRPILERWERLDLEVPSPYNPRIFAEHMRQFVDKTIFCEENKKPGTIFLVERQSFRGGGQFMIPGPIIMVNRVETMIHAMLLDRRVICIDAKTVAASFSSISGSYMSEENAGTIFNTDHHDTNKANLHSQSESFVAFKPENGLIPSLNSQIIVKQDRINQNNGNQRQQGTHTSRNHHGSIKKKNVASIIVDELVERVDLPVIIPNHLKKMYVDSQKKDDLADSLLQALVYLKWQSNLTRVLDRLRQFSEGS